MYNPNVPSSNMGIAPISGQPSQPLGPAPMVGPAPMGPMGAPPPMAPPMMGGMPPPPMMAPPPMAPPIAPITEGLGGFGGSSAGRAGFSERMQRMTAPPKPRPMPQPMPMSQPVQRMNMGGAVSSQGLSMYQPPMMPRPMGMMGGVPNRVEPLRMALGGFIGNSTTRDYSDDDPFGTDDLLDSLGIPDFDPNKDFGGGGDDSGGDDDDYYDYLDDNYVYTPPPAPAPPVVVPEPEPESGDDDIKNMILAEAAKQVAGAKNDIQLSDGTVLSESDLKPVVGTSGSVENLDNISSLVSDLNAQLGNTASIDAVGAAPVVGSGDAGPEIFTDVPNILGQNPISLLSPLAPSPISVSGRQTPGGGIVPSGPIDFGGSYVPPKVNRSTLSPDFAQPELLNENQTEAFFNRDTRRPDMLNIALPGGSSKTRIEDDGLANAMAAAQGIDASKAAAINALGSDAYTGVFEPEFVEPTPAEVMASNRRAMAEARADDAANVQPQTFVGGFNQYPDPSDIQLEMAPSTDGGPAIPNNIQLDVAPYNSGNLTSGDIADLLVNTPGAQKFLQENPDFKAGDKAKPFFETFAPSTDTMDAMGRGMPSTPYSDPYAGDIVTTDVRTDLGIGTPYYRVGDPIDETTQKMLDKSPLKGAMLGESLTPTDVTFLNSPEMNIFASTAPAQTEDVASTAPAQTVPVPADPDGGGKIVPAKDYAESDYKSPGVLDDYVDPYEDQYVKDSYEQQLFGDPPKTVQAFGGLVKLLSGGLIDINKLTAEHRRKGLKAYLETNELAYENGVVVGVKDPEGRTIYLGPQSPKEEDNTGGDDDGCPPGFRKINGVCMPMRQNRVAQNPATAISDSINKATLPSTLRPVVRDVVDDDDEEEETSDVGGLTIRRPKYFAGGGAVSEGMGSAIDSFISAMGGNVKKKSNVEPVNMQKGGAVSNFLSDFSSWQERNKGDQSWADYHSSYGTQHQHNERGRQARERMRNNEFGIDLDPVAPSNPNPSDFTLSGSGSYFEPEPEPDNIVQRSLRPQLRPASFAPEPVEPVKDLPSYYTDEFKPLLPVVDMTADKKVVTDLSEPASVDSVSIRSLRPEDIGEEILNENLQAELGISLNPQLTVRPYSPTGNAFYFPSLTQVKRGRDKNLTPESYKIKATDVFNNDVLDDSFKLSPEEYDSVFDSIDPNRPQMGVSKNFATKGILGHELGHGAFEEVVGLLYNQREPYSMPMNNLGGIVAMQEGDPRPRRLSAIDDKNALGTFQYEYGYPLSGKISEELFGRGGFSLGKDHNEGMVQYFDETMGDDPRKPGVGQPITEGGSTYYQRGFDDGATDPYLQKQFETYRKGLPVPSTYIDGAGNTVSFDKRLAEEGLDGYEMALSDLIAKRNNLDPYAERQRRRLPISPLGYLPGRQVGDEFGGVGVARSFRPQLRPNAPLTSLRPRLRPQGLGSR